AFRTLDRVVLGTPEYMSPEQASGSTIDHRSDLYSLGCITYEMLLGRLPFDADSPVGFIGKHIVDPPMPFDEGRPGHGVSPAIEAFVMKALEKDPDERFQSADEMLKALEAAAPAEVQASLDVSNRIKMTKARSPGPSDSGLKTQEPAAAASAPATPSPSASNPPRPASEKKAARVVPVARTSAVEARKQKSALPLVAAAAAALVVFMTLLIVVAVRVMGKAPLEKRLAAAKALSDPAAASGDWEGAKKPYKELLERAADSERAAIEEELGKIGVRESAAIKLALRKRDFDEAVAKAQKLLSAEDAANEAPLQAAIDKARGSMGKDDAAVIADLEAKQRGWKMRFEEKLGEKLAKDPSSLDSALDHLRAARERAEAEPDQKRLDARIADVEGDRHFREASRFLAAGRFDEAASEARRALDVNATQERKDLVEEIERQRGQADLTLRKKAIESATSDGDSQDSRERFEEAQRSYEAGLAEARKSPAIDAAVKQLEEKLSLTKKKLEAVAAFAKLPALPAKDAPDAAVREAIDRRREYAKAYPDGPRTKRALEEAASLESSAAGTVAGKARAERQAAIDAARAALQDEKEDAARAALERAKKAQASLPASENEPVKKLEEEMNAHFAIAKTLKKDFVLVPKGKRPQGWTGPDLPSFFMGKFEVTNVDYLKFCNDEARKGQKPRWPDGWDAAEGDLRMPPGGKSSYPVVNVSFEDAQAYCAWLTASAPKAQKIRYRLPHEVEWERAGRGDDARRWPWGDEFKEDKVRWWKDSEGKATDSPAPEVEKAWSGGASPFGAIHMAGNVAEWIDDPFEDETGTKIAGTKALKGGSFRSSRQEQVQMTGPSSRAKAEPGNRFDYAGFRVLAEIVKD
ncbi:SUMF1/EgtB/PvdO family nonheme iron enzyme, partial [bacterium]|nr:SUMF1/EgtB/PvdO family nonheme iron enzyme [bacterium]